VRNAPLNAAPATPTLLAAGGLLATVLIALGGCHSDYASVVELPQDCEREWYFEDRDGDGWGRPGGNAELRCSADSSEEAQLTARNDLDCDDGEETDLELAADVTGRIAAICPDELVLGGASSYAFQAGGSEFAAVLPTLDYSHVGQTDPDVTALVSAPSAAVACGADGWGGDLATFDNLTELREVTGTLEDIVGDEGYAAYVGLVPDGTGWRWVDDSTLPPNELGFCVGDGPTDSEKERNPGLHLALVKPPGEDWCFGYPTDANPEGKDPDEPEDALPEDQFFFRRLYANFICEREPPRALDFTVDRDPNASSDEG